MNKSTIDGSKLNVMFVDNDVNDDKSMRVTLSLCS